MTNLKALTAFCHVLRDGSLLAAAEHMNLSQPAVSRLISNLEHDIRLVLFHRDRRSLRPTEEARRFYREAERILAGVENLSAIAADIRGGSGQRLRVVAMSRLAVGAVPQAVTSFRAKMPEVHLTVEIHHRRDMERWISGRQFDVGFGPLPITDASLDAVPLADVPLVAVAAPSFFSAYSEQPSSSITAAALAHYPMISLTPDTLLQSQISAIFSAAGVVPEVGLQVSSSHVACLTAATGVGYAVTDLVTAHTLSERVQILPVEPRFEVTFGQLTAAGQAVGPAAASFTDEMQEAMSSILSLYDFASKA